MAKSRGEESVEKAHAIENGEDAGSVSNEESRRRSTKSRKSRKEVNVGGESEHVASRRKPSLPTTAEVLSEIQIVERGEDQSSTARSGKSTSTLSEEHGADTKSIRKSHRKRKSSAKAKDTATASMSDSGEPVPLSRDKKLTSKPMRRASTADSALDGSISKDDVNLGRDSLNTIKRSHSSSDKLSQAALVTGRRASVTVADLSTPLPTGGSLARSSWSETEQGGSLSLDKGAQPEVRQRRRQSTPAAEINISFKNELNSHRRRRASKTSRASESQSGEDVGSEQDGSTRIDGKLASAEDDAIDSDFLGDPKPRQRASSAAARMSHSMSAPQLSDMGRDHLKNNSSQRLESVIEAPIQEEENVANDEDRQSKEFAEWPSKAISSLKEATSPAGSIEESHVIRADQPVVLRMGSAEDEDMDSQDVSDATVSESDYQQSRLEGPNSMRDSSSTSSNKVKRRSSKRRSSSSKGTPSSSLVALSLQSNEIVSKASPSSPSSPMSSPSLEPVPEEGHRLVPNGSVAHSREDEEHRPRRRSERRRSPHRHEIETRNHVDYDESDQHNDILKLDHLQPRSHPASCNDAGALDEVLSPHAQHKVEIIAEEDRINGADVSPASESSRRKIDESNFDLQDKDIEYQGEDEDDEDEADGSIDEYNNGGLTTRMDRNSRRRRRRHSKQSERESTVGSDEERQLKEKHEVPASAYIEQPPQPTNLVSVITELSVEQQDVGFGFNIMDDGTLELSGLDYDLFKEAVPDIESAISKGNRIIYMGERSFFPLTEDRIIDDDDIREKDAIMEWINTQERPLRVGIERFVPVPSNLQISSGRPSLLAPPRELGVVDSKWVARRRSKLEPEGTYRPPPGPFTPGWDWLMRIKDYPVAEIAHRAWVRPQDSAGWCLATLDECYKTSMRVRCDGATESIVVPLDRALPVHPGHIDVEYVGDDQLSEFDDLNEAVIAFRLRDRFVRRKQVFTWISTNVLAAVNPCHEVSDLFTPKALPVSSYLMSPSAHIFALADQAFDATVNGDAAVSQSVVLTGMSGSGKSRLGSELVHYLTTSKSALFDKVAFEKQITAAEIILQAFGNASSVRCADTTCYTKNVRLIMRPSSGNSSSGSSSVEPQYAISSVWYEAHMFDVNRLVQKPPLERNFHIFYQLCNGWSEAPVSQNLDLDKPSRYQMLGSDDVTFRRHLKPKDKHSSKFRYTRASAYRATLSALSDIGLDTNVQEDLMRILTALLLLSNVQFEENPEYQEDANSDTETKSAVAKAVVSTVGNSASSLERACHLLGVGHARLSRAFLFRDYHDSDDLASPFNPEGAAEMRNRFIEHVYSNLFDFLLGAINAKLGHNMGRRSPGVEDLCLNVVEYASFVYGIAGEDIDQDFMAPSCGMRGTSADSPATFATSPLLSSEALFQNFANEVLEHLYEDALHRSEQARLPDLCQEVARSKPLRASQQLLSMFVGHPEGVFCLLDEQSLIRGRQSQEDADLVQVLLVVHESKRYLQRAMFGYESFRVRHYGGSFLEYDARGLVSANARPCQVSSVQFLELFHQGVSSVLSLLYKEAQFRAHKQQSETEILNQRAETRTTAQNRREEISALSEILESTNQWFVRCFMPNLSFHPMVWDDAAMVRQFDYAGFRQLCDVRNQLFPTRVCGDDVVVRFWPIARRFEPEIGKHAPDILEVILGPERTRWLSTSDDPHADDAVFYLSLKAQRILECCRWRVRDKAATKLQHEFMKLVEKIEAVVKIQRFVYERILDPAFYRSAALRILNAFRLFRIRNDFLIVRGAAIRIQALARRFLCRSSDVRASTMVLPIQKYWRGHLVRQRMKMATICRNQSCARLTSIQSPIRSSMVLITNSVPGLPKAAKRKRQILVLTNNPGAQLILLDPVTGKRSWEEILVPDITTASIVQGGDSKEITSVQVNTQIGGVLRTLSFCDVLRPEDHNGWASDITNPPTFIDFVLSPLDELAGRFSSSFLTNGQMQLRIDKDGSRSAWKDRFAILHQNILFLYIREEITEQIEIDAETQVKALNVVDQLGHNYLEITVGPGQVHMFRMSDAALRERWAQALAWMIHLKRGSTRLSQLRQESQSKKLRSISFVDHALAVNHIRTSGEFPTPDLISAAALSSSYSLDHSRRYETTGRRLSKILSVPAATSNPLSPTAKIEFDDSKGDNTRPKAEGGLNQQRQQRILAVAKHRKLLEAKARALSSRQTVSLYHIITSEPYAEQFCSNTVKVSKSWSDWYRVSASVQLQMGDEEEAWASFVENAPLKERIVESFQLPLPSTGDRLDGLLLFTNLEAPRRRRRFRNGASAIVSSGSELDGFDAEAFDDDEEDGRLLSELLDKLGLSQYMDGFRSMGFINIRSVKQLTHDELPEFGVKLFAHQDKLIRAFHNYGRVGSALSQPRRPSQRLEDLYESGPRFEDAIIELGLEDWRSKLVERGIFSVEELGSLNKQKLSKLGVGSHHDRKQILEKIKAGGPLLKKFLRPGASRDGHKKSSSKDRNSKKDLKLDALDEHDEDDSENDADSIKANIKPLTSEDDDVADEDKRMFLRRNRYPRPSVANAMAGADRFDELSNNRSETKSASVDDRELLNQELPPRHHRRHRSLDQVNAGSATRLRTRSRSRTMETKDDNFLGPFRNKLRGGLSGGSSSLVEGGDDDDNSIENSTWKCRICQFDGNDPEQTRCEQCGKRSAHNAQYARHESSRGMEDAEPWVCGVCRRVNTSEQIVCENCQTFQGDAYLPVSEAFPPLKFEMGDRVKLTVNNVYDIERNATGMVIEAFLTSPHCQVQFDEGLCAKVSVDHLKKIPPRQGTLGRLNTFFSKLVPHSSSRRFSPFSSPHGMTSSATSPVFSSPLDGITNAAHVRYKEMQKRNATAGRLSLSTGEQGESGTHASDQSFNTTSGIESAHISHVSEGDGTGATASPASLANAVQSYPDSASLPPPPAPLSSQPSESPPSTGTERRGKGSWSSRFGKRRLSEIKLKRSKEGPADP